MEFVNKLPNSNIKSRLLDQIKDIQDALDDKVEARYVYFEIHDEGTSMNQLVLSITEEFWTGKIMERIEGNPIINIPSNYNNDKNTIKFVYNTLGDPKEGDIFSANLRFEHGVTSIDAIITNLGDGNWKIESDWLVERK